MTEPPRPSPPVIAIGPLRRTPGSDRQGRVARRVSRVLEAMAYSRRFEELLAEARYRNRLDLYRVSREPRQ
jgi:hypothetical protein